MLCVSFLAVSSTYRLSVMLDTWPGNIFFVLITIIVIVVFGIITFRITQGYIWFTLMLLQIHGLVQVLVDDVIFRRLLANVVI